ncbi:MAG: Uma2 family endonuclease [Anaerolineae bacterium]
MFATDLPLSLSPDAYLALERRAEFKSEYIDGVVVAMSGASMNHNRIVRNILLSLAPGLMERGCDIVGSDLRVEAESSYFYPDAVIVCGEPEFTDAAVDTLTNPTVLFEVLSPSTERLDRTIKSAAYRRLPSLQAFVLIDQERPFVECMRRHGPFWVYESYSGLDDVLRLEAVGSELALAELYVGIGIAAEAT